MLNYFFSKARDATFRHYLSQPKPRMENDFIKALESNPDLVKIFHDSSLPTFRYIIIKNLAKELEDKIMGLDVDWELYEPKPIKYEHLGLISMY